MAAAPNWAAAAAAVGLPPTTHLPPPSHPPPSLPGGGHPTVLSAVVAYLAVPLPVAVSRDDDGGSGGGRDGSRSDGDDGGGGSNSSSGEDGTSDGSTGVPPSAPPPPLLPALATLTRHFTAVAADAPAASTRLLPSRPMVVIPPASQAALLAATGRAAEIATAAGVDDLHWAAQWAVSRGDLAGDGPDEGEAEDRGGGGGRVTDLARRLARGAEALDALRRRREATARTVKEAGLALKEADC
ncbi:hypothetical protein MMPV_007835 [Pyropia vietnamensis]